METLEDPKEVYDRIYEGCLKLDTLTLLRLLRHRTDRLAVIQEHEMPKIIKDYQEAMVSATKQAAQDRGIL